MVIAVDAEGGVGRLDASIRYHTAARAASHCLRGKNNLTSAFRPERACSTPQEEGAAR